LNWEINGKKSTAIAAATQPIPLIGTTAEVSETSLHGQACGAGRQSHMGAIDLVLQCVCPHSQGKLVAPKRSSIWIYGLGVLSAVSARQIPIEHALWA